MGIFSLQRLAAVASPGHAVTLVKFAEFSQPSVAPANVFWSNPGNTTSATFFTGTSISKAASVPIEFSFVNNPAVSSVHNLDATLLIYSSGVTATPAASSSDQKGVFGSFTINSVSDFFVGLTHYAAGTKLLAGDFSSGEIAGIPPGSVGAALAATVGGSVVHFSSDVAGAVKAHSFARDLVLNLDAITPVLDALPGKALKTFKANADGAFAQAVPEPATWAMMIVGLGGIGAAVRRRRTLAAG